VRSTTHRIEHLTDRRRTARRAALASIAAFGAVLTLAGTTGVFAVFTDRATTGTNSWASKGLPRAADLQLATGSVDVGVTWTVSCGTYADDLTSGFITMTNAAANDGFGGEFVCLKNAGSQTVDVTTSAIDIADVDTACTGDEAAVDATCGPGVNDTPRAGELSPLVQASMIVADCANANQGGLNLGALTILSN
jgi:hypothetical protein